ncbi:unnamed protein product [Anisakis simplex]|uniref:Pept_C1 domain-containing protein n=1 Tax=Anisakis simplex TaxID=6269 RepID=A0A0M3JF53_ANISI|nr:unnamed protein product [Anisakis simplex]
MLAICPVDQETDCDGRGAVSGIPGAYRRVDGYCNNVRTGWWGSTYAPMQRLLEPDYADGTCTCMRASDFFHANGVRGKLQNFLFGANRIFFWRKFRGENSTLKKFF